MHFDPEQISDHWRPCRIFGAMARFTASRNYLTPVEFSMITGIPEEEIYTHIKNGNLPEIISRDAGFLFLWGTFLANLPEGVPNETK